MLIVSWYFEFMNIFFDQVRKRKKTYAKYSTVWKENGKKFDFEL